MPDCLEMAYLLAHNYGLSNPESFLKFLVLFKLQTSAENFIGFLTVCFLFDCVLFMFLSHSHPFSNVTKLSHSHGLFHLSTVIVFVVCYHVVLFDNVFALFVVILQLFVVEKAEAVAESGGV